MEEPRHVVDVTEVLPLRFTVRYFKEDWIEDEELSFQHATPMAAHAALLTWVEALTVKSPTEHYAATRLREIVEVVLEVERGEKAAVERERACSSGRGGDARSS